MYVPMIAGEEEIPIKKYLYLILMKNQLGNVKECKTLIKKGYVMINAQCVKDPHYLVCKEDKIRVQGKVIEAMPFVYYMINKPVGYICAAHDQKYPCLLELIDRDDCYCVGRLDKDTTGFVLLTNDKSLSKKLLLPHNHVEKTYEVQTKLPIKENYVEAFQKGIIKGLKEEGKVALVGFATFSLKVREAREGINPLTKEPMKIPAKKVVNFKAGSKLKDAVNQ